MNKLDSLFKEVENSDASIEEKVDRMNGYYNSYVSFIPPRGRKRYLDKIQEIDTQIKEPEQEIKIVPVENRISQDKGIEKNDRMSFFTTKSKIDKEYVVEDVKGSTIVINETVPFFVLRRIGNTKVELMDVKTSLFCEDCEDCTIQIKCQQLRLTRCKDMRIIANTKTGVFLEECAGIVTEELIDESGAENKWNCIFDFTN
eukprot:GHVP01030828.1.p1 GENE.GHVP01030828.1~~GHVP01030828.1.p1  ORF type:complete len:201 (+),score=41.72 GHVP01030828.1:52-654(+)